jgi:hypothetical protein
MSDAYLIASGEKMRGLVYRLTYGGDCQLCVPAFSIQLTEARAERRGSHPKEFTGKPRPS